MDDWWGIDGYWQAQPYVRGRLRRFGTAGGGLASQGCEGERVRGWGDCVKAPTLHTPALSLGEILCAPSFWLCSPPRWRAEESTTLTTIVSRTGALASFSSSRPRRS